MWELVLFQLKYTTKQRENITAVPVTTFPGAQLCIYPEWRWQRKCVLYMIFPQHSCRNEDLVAWDILVKERSFLPVLCHCLDVLYDAKVQKWQCKCFSCWGYGIHSVHINKPESVNTVSVAQSKTVTRSFGGVSSWETPKSHWVDNHNKKNIKISLKMASLPAWERIRYIRCYREPCGSHSQFV